MDLQEGSQDFMHYSWESSKYLIPQFPFSSHIVLFEDREKEEKHKLQVCFELLQS